MAKKVTSKKVASKASKVLRDRIEEIGTFVPSVLDGKVEGGHTPRACARLADQDQIAYVLQEMFHGGKSLRQRLWLKRLQARSERTSPYLCLITRQKPKKTQLGCPQKQARSSSEAHPPTSKIPIT